MSTPDPRQYKAYLGDAVYADWDGMHIVLTVENGEHVSQRICLDGEVWRYLLRYQARLEQMIDQRRDSEPSA